MKAYIKILSFAVISGIVSCTSVLDKENLTSINPDDVWGNEKMVDAVINDIQGELMPGWPYDDGEMSDEAPHRRANMNTFLKGTATIDDWDVWPYTHIEKINLFLKNVEETTFENKKPAWKGQALFWRAWCYFNMVKGYGGVPLILEPQDVSDRESLFVERASTSDCFAQIVKDLDDAIACLPDTWSGGDYGRIDKCAAMAFKGRVLLFHASPLFNPQRDNARWEAAYKANKDAVDFCLAQGKGLYPDYKELWYDERNEEVIMVNQFFVPDHKYGQNKIRPMSFTRDNVAFCLPMMNTVNAFPMKDGSDFDPEKTDYAILFKNRDDRFYTSVAYNGCEYKIKDLNPGEFLWTGRDSQGQSIEFPIHNPGENFDPINTGFICKKSIDPNIDKSTVFDAAVDWTEIRFAEVLMNYGECANELGKTDEALDVLYQIRKRANIEPGTDNRYGLKETTQDAVRERYIKERFVEFLFEGKRLHDLRRWKRFDIINDQKKQYGIQSWLKPGQPLPKITDDINEIWDHFEPHIVEVTPQYTYDMKEQYYFYAIPRKHLDANPKLKQNKNWDGGEFDPVL